jgi:transcriptional regulator with XRE-family HTH domain
MQPKKPPGLAGERVRALREALGLTQQKLADGGGLSRDDVSRIETGRNKARSSRVRKGLATGFGLSLEAMFAFVEGELSVAAAAKSAKPPEVP